MKSILFLLTICTVNAYSQAGNEAIKKPIQALFEGMRTADTALMQSAFAPTAILQTIVTSKDGKVAVRTENVAEFIAFIGKPHEAIYDERISFEAIHVNADLASVWTPYKFYVGEKFSHCGVNSFQLVKLAGEWKIQYLIDTRQKEGCQ